MGLDRVDDARITISAVKHEYLVPSENERCILGVHGYGIDRHGMWQMLRVYGVERKLLKALQSFYVVSRDVFG